MVHGWERLKNKSHFCIGYSRLELELGPLSDIIIPSEGEHDEKSAGGGSLEV